MKKYLEKQDAIINYEFVPVKSIMNLTEPTVVEHKAVTEYVTFHIPVDYDRKTFIRYSVLKRDILAIVEQIKEIEELRQELEYDPELPF